VGVAVAVTGGRIAEVSEGADPAEAGFLDAEQFNEGGGMALGLGLEEIGGFAQGKEPFVTILGWIGRQAIVADGAASTFDGTPGVGVIVGEGDDDMTAGDADEFSEGLVEVVQVFEDIGAQDEIEGAVGEGDPFLFEVHDPIGGTADIDADVVEAWDEAFEVGAIASDVEDTALDEREEAACDEAGAFLAIVDGYYLTMHDGGRSREETLLE
jgi:hypothetical protein